ADAGAELALLAVFLAADVLAEIIVGAGVVLPAKKGDFAMHGRIDLLPVRDRSTFGPDFTQFFHRDFLDGIRGVRVDRQRVVSDDELPHVLARDFFGFLNLFGLDFARGVADVAGVVLQRGKAGAG